jgi:hypothetical protein
MSIAEYLEGMDENQKMLALQLLEGYYQFGESCLFTIPPAFKSIGLSFEPQEDGSLVAKFHYKTELGANPINEYIH